MTAPAPGFLRTSGRRLLDGTGTPVRLRGVGLGGWLNMENFITGYAANESLMRSHGPRGARRRTATRRSSIGC